MLDGGVGGSIAPTATAPKSETPCAQWRGMERPPIRQKYPPDG